MDRGRSYLILTLVLLAGIGLSVFIYLQYGVTLIVFIIPIIGIGGSLFSRVLRRRPARHHETRREYDDYKHRVRYTVKPEGDGNDDKESDH